MFVYHAADYKFVDSFIKALKLAALGLGIILEGEPVYVEIPCDNDLI